MSAIGAPIPLKRRLGTTSLEGLPETSFPHGPGHCPSPRARGSGTQGGRTMGTQGGRRQEEPADPGTEGGRTTTMATMTPHERAGLLEGQVAVVTGGAAGIGGGASRRLAA